MDTCLGFGHGVRSAESGVLSSFERGHHAKSITCIAKESTTKRLLSRYIAQDPAI